MGHHFLLIIFALLLVCCIFWLIKICFNNKENGFGLKDFIKKSISDINGAIEESYKENGWIYHIRGDETRKDVNPGHYGDIGFDLTVSTTESKGINVISNKTGIGGFLTKASGNVSKIKFTLSSSDTPKIAIKRETEKEEKKG